MIHKKGLSLFFRQGMAAWATHWSGCIAQEKKRGFFSAHDASGSKDAMILKPVMPDDMVLEITKLINTMVIRTMEGAWMSK